MERLTPFPWKTGSPQDVVTAKIIGDEAYKRELDALGESQSFMDNFRQICWILKHKTKKVSPDLQHFRRDWQIRVDEKVQEFIQERNASRNLSFAES